MYAADSPVYDSHAPTCAVTPAANCSCCCAAAGYVSQKKPEAAAYDLSYASTPFSFAVTRAGVENSTAIFSTRGHRLVFKVCCPFLLSMTLFHSLIYSHATCCIRMDQLL